jgi:hypothetical protein
MAALWHILARFITFQQSLWGHGDRSIEAGLKKFRHKFAIVAKRRPWMIRSAGNIKST